MHDCNFRYHTDYFTHKINRIDLLERLFGEVLIPEAVFRELTTNTLYSNEVQIVKASSFMKTYKLQYKLSTNFDTNAFL